MFGFSKKKTDVAVTEITPKPLENTETTVIESPKTEEAPKKTGFFARLTSSSASEMPENSETEVSQPPEVTQKVGLFARLKQGLSRTREGLTKGLANLFLGRKVIDAELLEDIETLLLTADVGVESTQVLINDLTDRVSRKQLADPEALFQALKQNMVNILSPVEQPLILPPKTGKPFVILMVGINGAGKTTTIGKLAKRFQTEGRSVMLAAGDTFRAAAVEQLKAWGERNQVAVIAQHSRADSASVIYDALQAAIARKVDILIADTAGRLHTQGNLMEELKKVCRVIKKLDETAPHETMLIVDAGTGQNALAQARQFHQAVGLTGITVTKLDGTAKGGIIFAIAKQIGLPLRFIGVGEQLDDLRSFEAENFVSALLSRD